MIANNKHIAAIITAFLIGCFSFGSLGETTFAEASASVNETLAETYVDADVTMKNAPSVICDVTDQTVLNGLIAAVEADGARPANAIVRFNQNCEVVDKSGAKLGDFQTLYEDVFAGEIIPVVYVGTEQAANALITFLTEKIDIADIAVTSNIPVLVKKVRQAKNTVRGIISYSETMGLAEIVQSANENLATTVILPSRIATVENVRFVHKRMQSVWVDAENGGQMGLNDCIQSGAYGVISSNYAAVYSAYETYGESLCRTPINIVYQTGNKFHHENSKLGAQKAIAYADAVHMDARLTRDGKIVLMYDETIDRTSNGEGKVNSFTLSEIQSFELDMIEDEHEVIPALDDVIPVFQDTDAVLWLELQDGTAQMVSALRDLLVEHEFFDQIVVTAQDETISLVKSEIPEISTVIKRTVKEENYQAVAKDVATYNSNVLHDLKNGIDVTVSAQSFLKDRGICAIFSGVSKGMTKDTEIDARMKEGVLGFLHNYAAYYQAREILIKGKADTRASLSVGDKVTVTVTTYNVTVTEAKGQVVALEDKGDYWLVVASYVGKLGLPLYTQSFKITEGKGTSTPTNPVPDSGKQDTTSDSSDSGDQASVGCGANIGIGLPSLAILGCGIFFLLKNKEQVKRRKQ